MLQAHNKGLFRGNDGRSEERAETDNPCLKPVQIHRDPPSDAHNHIGRHLRYFGYFGRSFPVTVDLYQFPVGLLDVICIESDSIDFAQLGFKSFQFKLEFVSAAAAQEPLQLGEHLIVIGERNLLSAGNAHYMIANIGSNWLGNLPGI